MTGRFVLPVMICTSLAGCVLQPDPNSVSAGARAFQANCAGCHGASAEGGVYPGAPSLRGLAAGNGGVFPAARVLGVLDGHARTPAFNEAMPEFGGQGMGAGPATDVPGLAHPVPARTAGLLAYLASIQD